MGENARSRVPVVRMPALRFLFLLFLLVPLVEIYLLVKVGQVIGAASTIALVVLTAVLGAILLRWQGLSTLNRVRGALARGELPALPLLEGLCLLLAGALLLTPGFFTDAIGFALFVPPLRRAVGKWLVGSLLVPQRPGGPGPQRSGPRAIEGEVTRRDD